MSDRLPEEFDALAPKLRAWRRDFHAHPEPGYGERRSGKIIAETLQGLGFEVRRLAETGVVGLWPGTDPDLPALAFRADMDALPITEESAASYRSQTPGLMHACGHDGHMAILLGFAQWLAERPKRFAGPITLLFQPAEEGLGGARRMIAEGALTAPRVAEIYGLHVWSPLASGLVGVRPGPMMASSDRFAIAFFGKGGHGAMPHLAKDALLAAAEFVGAAQSLVAREIDPLDSAVVSVCQFHAGTADNIIPESAVVRGTTRALRPEIRSLLPKRLRALADGVAAAHELSVEFTWIDQYPPTLNHERPAARVRAVAEGLLGQARVPVVAPSMAAEDMSYYLNEIPGAYFWLGSGSEAKGTHWPHHNPRFDLDEDVLPLGVALFAGIAEDYFS